MVIVMFVNFSVDDGLEEEEENMRNGREKGEYQRLCLPFYPY